MPDNHLRVARAFDIWTKAAAPMVGAALKEHGGAQWWANCVLAILRDHQKRGLPTSGNDDSLLRSLDAARLLLLIDLHWNLIFKDKLGFDARNWIKEAIGDRNKAAHRGALDFTTDDCWRMIDTLRRILSRFDDGAAKRAQDLRDSCASKPAEAGHAAAAQSSRSDPPPPQTPGANRGIWARVQRELSSQEIVRNWTQAKGYLGDSFKITSITQRSIQVEAPSALNLQNISERDFKEVYALWRGYLKGEVPRKAFMPLTRNSKYVISILHHLKIE